MTENNNPQVNVEEVPQEVLDLRQRTKLLAEGQSRLQDAIVIANRFGTEIGEKLLTYAEANSLCEEYDEWLKQFSDEVLNSGVWEAFYEAAKREVPRVRKTFRANLAVEVESDDYNYDFSMSDECYEEGEYELPEDLEINDLDDLDDDRVEHISGTDLVDWVRTAENGIDVSVSAEVNDFMES